ncbi:MAG: hypothetical protein QOJ15_10856 [Bradyrhizobium sp.]|nr:hypothetical protein [Bradyrhizobium sp.]
MATADQELPQAEVSPVRGIVMRRLLLGSVISIVALVPGFGNAGPRSLQVEASNVDKQSATSNYETYRGYVFDLSENSERKDVTAIADLLKQQLDIVEGTGLSPKVLQFFHTVPIVASEMACMEEGAGVACYGLAVPERARHASRDLTVWDPEKRQWSNSDIVDLAADAGRGVIMMRPAMLRYAQDPVVLHELLHAYHAKLMPDGFDNRGIKGFYNLALSKQAYGKDEYVLKNHKEFFAVTASIFLAGNDTIHEPHTRVKLKEKQPEYYKYLVGVFGFDPDASTVTPVASAN